MHACNVILTALTEFLRHFRNGNGETATAERERQRNGGNQALLRVTEESINQQPTYLTRGIRLCRRLDDSKATLEDVAFYVSRRAFFSNFFPTF